jgi:Spy/CpxP family protein refolding chaperone
MKIRSMLLPTLAGAALLIGCQTLPSMPEASAQTPSNSQAPMMGHTPDHQPGYGQGEMGDRMFDQLNLSEDQRQQIEAIYENAQTNADELMQQLDSAHETMRSLWSSDASNSELEAQHDVIQDLQQQMDDQHFQTMLAVRDVLTPEQRAQLATSMPDHPAPGQGHGSGSHHGF